MAVKAKAEITISHLIDISSVTRYYLLQSSTSAAPAKPTTNPPPSAWSKTEPSYTSGSTNTLYFVDCTEFTNDTFKYSEVSKSSSYEAAKEAYNRVVAVEGRVTNAETNINQNKQEINLRATKTEVDYGRNGNLLKNGYGEYLDNTNHQGGTFTRGDCPDGSYGYFNGGSFTDYILFNKNFIYDLEYSRRLHSGKSGAAYFSIVPYDVDGNIINMHNVLDSNKNLFYLSQDLNNGDTVAHFTDLTAWATTGTYNKNFLIFGYTDKTGYTYPDGTYSQNYYSYVYTDGSSVDKTNNTITLSSAWNKGTVKSGTCIGQSNMGSQYCYYGKTGSITNTEWETNKGTIQAGNTDNASERRLLYANRIKVNLYNTVADYAGIYIGIHTTDNDVRKQLNEDINSLRTDVSNQKDSLKDYVRASDYEAYKKTVVTESKLSQTFDAIKLEFQTEITSTYNDLNKSITELLKYFRFSNDGLEIGTSENSLKLVLDNDIIRFVKNGQSFGWWDGIDFHTGNIMVDVTEQAQFGNFAFVPNDDGSLMFLKVDNVVGSNLFNLNKCEFESNIISYKPIGITGASVHITQSALSSVHFTLDATKTYRISYISKNALINGYDSSSTPWVKKFEQRGDGFQTITVTGAAEYYFSALDVADYTFKDVKIVEVN